MDDLGTLAGRTLMVGLPGPVLDAVTEGRLRAIAPGGVILFARNVESAHQTAALVHAVRRCLGSPVMIALDQEGGRVNRLEPLVGATPSALRLALAGSEATHRFASSTARVMSALGFNLDFAPVVDLSVEDATNGIADRSFGTDPERVSALAGAFLEGLQEGGVAGCLKHFPGLGRTRVDSHRELPVAERTRLEIDREELVPFQRLARTAASVMIAHVHYRALDPVAGRPATLSPPVVTDLLRGELGYAGLVVSDDLEMGAVSALDVEGAAAVGAMLAGCDLLLYCSDLDRATRARQALTMRAGADPVFERRLRAAAEVVEATARRWPGFDNGLGGFEQARRELQSRLAEV